MVALKKREKKREEEAPRLTEACVAEMLVIERCVCLCELAQLAAGESGSSMRELVGHQQVILT